MFVVENLPPIVDHPEIQRLLLHFFFFYILCFGTHLF